MYAGAIEINLEQSQFVKISDKLRDVCGINLVDGKQELVKARLRKRIVKLGLHSFEQYLDYIDQDKSGAELDMMVQELTTNTTHFFRELKHFEYLKEKIIPQIRKNEPFRIWSAGCSSGEEPYSIAMMLREEISNISAYDIKILATDISPEILDRAKNAVYSDQTVQPVEPKYVSKYFAPMYKDSQKVYQVKTEVRSMIQFARLNLMNSWPMKSSFDLILCRNVMIYFNHKTRETLINKFAAFLKPEGYILIGHSESLTAMKHQLKYIQPAVYQNLLGKSNQKPR